MKNQYKKYSMLLLLLVALFLSCEKDHDFTPYAENVSTTDAKLKFIHTAVGPNGTNFSINYLINDKKVSAVSVSSGLPIGFNYGFAYPLSINYAFIQAGTQTLKVVKPATTAISEILVTSNIITTEPGKNYSSFLVGLSPDYSIFNINDDLSVSTINPNKAYIRFINLIANTPAGGYDLGIIKTTAATTTSPEFKTEIKKFESINFKGGSEVFIPLETIKETENTPYEIQLRSAGTTTVITSYTNGFVFRAGRIYTIFSRGYVGGLSNGLPSATANIPTVILYVNK